MSGSLLFHCYLGRLAFREELRVGWTRYLWEGVQASNRILDTTENFKRNVE